MLEEHNSIQEQYPDTNPQEIIAAMLSKCTGTSSVIKAKDVKVEPQLYTFQRFKL